MTSPVQSQSLPVSGRSGLLRWYLPRSWAGRVVGFVLALMFMLLLTSIAIAAYERSRARSAVGPLAAQPSLPVMFSLPDFSLTERSGNTVTLATLKGKVWIADFIFTNCAGPCPMMTRQMSGLQAALAGEPDVQLVTFTVDPARDTPERLTEYAQQFRAHPQRWLFLTGDKQAIYDLSTQGFKLAALVEGDELATSDHPILHSTKFVLVDRQGQIRKYYDGTSAEEVDQLKVDAARLAAEGR
jgi:protein SCO1